MTYRWAMSAAVSVLKSLVLSLVSALVFLAFAGEARADSEPDFWPEVQALVANCAVQPFAIDAAGTKVYGLLKSRCPELRRIEDGLVRFMNRGQPYFVRLLESADADGADLANLELLDYRKRPVATLSNVVAFGDAMLAIAGGNIELPEEYDPSLIASE